MSGVGLEVLLEGLIPEIAYAGEKGVSISELLKIVRQYHLSLGGKDATQRNAATGLQGAAQDADLESSLTEAEMSSARWAWDWLRSRPQILINGNKRWNRLELSEALALPEAGSGDTANPSTSGETNETQPEKGQKAKKTLTTRPRIHPSQDLVWQTLTRHGVDYKRVPALEWACLQGIASARAEGILQSDLRRLVNQDKRSLPKRTDSLARKGYVVKKTVVVQKMKTSRLWLIDFAPPDVETETCGLDLSPETLSKDLEPVQWHQRWTGSDIDMDALGRTAVGVVKAFNVMRYADLRSKMGVVGKRWQMKTLAKNCQRLVDMGVLKYTAASFPGSRKVFKDCLKFMREPSAEEWEKFLATGKKTSQYSDPTRHREPKPNALALYGKTGDDGQKDSDDRSKMKRIFSGWAPEKPLAQTVFEVIRSAGPEGASNPQVSVATVGYQHRRYLASYLTKVAETQQPPHLKRFQVVSKLVRTGKTSAYMFSAPEADKTAEEDRPPTIGSLDSDGVDPYGFGAIRPKAFPRESDLSLSALSMMARKSKPFSKRKILPAQPIKGPEEAETAPEAAAEGDAEMAEGQDHSELGTNRPPKRRLEETEESAEAVENGMVEPSQSAQMPTEKRPRVYIGTRGSWDPESKQGDASRESLVVTFAFDKPIESGIQQQNSPPTTAFTPANQAKKMSVESSIEDPVLNVRYNGIAGKLRLGRSDSTLTFLRSGRGLKKPLVIPIDENLDEPAIRDVPGGDDKSLVFAAGAKDDAPAWTYIFVFDDDSESQRIASSIQQQVMKIKSPAEAEPTPVPEEPPASQEITVEVAPARSGPTRGRGRGRGGGRGRGRKGQPLPPGVKPYVCSTCGGSWKNDLGLKYHLEKAQVPCNPNFDPATVLSRKRRRPSPAPPPSNANSEDEGTTGRSRRTKSARKAEKNTARPRFTVRTALRSTHDEVHGFRGLDFKAAGAVEEPPNRASERARLASRSALPQPNGPEGPTSVGTTFLPPAQFTGFGTRTSPESEARLSTPIDAGSHREPMASIEDEATQNLPVFKTGRATAIASHEQPGSVHPSLPTAPTTPSASRAYEDSLPDDAPFGGHPLSPAPYKASNLQPTGTTPLQNRYQGAPSSRAESPATGQPELAHNVYPEPPEPPSLSFNEEEVRDERPVPEAQAWPSHDEQTGMKPFVPSSNYGRMATDAKRRTAQAFDLINHLLDNNCGVFPGDKALFYALTKVFLKEFRNQMPPTWKNCQSAVKALESRKQATLHTHMLRTERGRLQTCTLLIRTGVDPNGMIPNIMKQKMRETYPGIYIPAAFSPTQEELALLQELDKKPPSPEKDPKPNANGQKFRSRRKYDEIEVFNAPYYTQSAPAIEPQKDPLWMRESEPLPEDGYDGRKRSAVEEPSPSPSQKRARTTSFQEPSTGPRASEFADQYDDIPVDPDIMGFDVDPGSPSQGRIRQFDASPQRDGPGRRRKYKFPSTYGSASSWERDPPSLIEAIKAYSLLPARLGGRGRRRSSSTFEIMGKLPAELGRIRNPGLASLPGSFFHNTGGVKTQPVSADIQFLDPNTGLDDDAGEPEEEDRVRASSPASSADAEDDAGDEATQPNVEEEVEEPVKYRFVFSSVLKDSSRGSWPMLEPSFFEHYDSSFTLNGWMPSRKRLLTENLPWSSEEMAAKSRAEKIRLRDWVDKNYAKFCSLVNQCAAWEQSPAGSAVMLGAAVTPHYIYINVSPPVSRANSREVSLKWSDDTQFNLETLPYEDLEDDDYGDVMFVDYIPARLNAKGDRQLKKRRIQKGPDGEQVRRMQGRPPKIKLQATKTMREHTAYPKTAEDFIRVPGDENEELDWSSENVRLAAFIVVTTLLGGVDRVVDWGLMLRLMPDQTISQLRHYWCALKKDRLSTIVSLTEKFRAAFLKAYENNEIPPIDFENVLAYDWKFLIKWTIQLDGTERRALPSSRKALEENFTLAKFKHGNREWREAYFHPQRSVFNKFQDATSESLAFPVDNIRDSRPNTDIIVSMSWTRSLCVTPVEAYSADAVLHRRNALFATRSKTEITELMNKGVDQLQRQGVISKSSSKWSNGRRWRFNTRVLDSLEKVAQQDKFAKAVQFKRELDQAFRAGAEKKRVTYITNDGMIMALLNLQASGRVRIETTGQPNVPMGHEPGNYETRKYTKKYMHFRLDIAPTESYLFDDGDGDGGDKEKNALADLRARVKAATPPTRGPAGAVPVWCDVFGKVDADRWLKYLSAVLVTLASRGSMNAEELVKTLKPVIMVFEAELIMEWAGKLGLLRAQLGGIAPAVAEWWWIAVEAQREALVNTVVGRPRKSLPSGRPAL